MNDFQYKQSMETNFVKAGINYLLGRYPDNIRYDAVGIELGITGRHVRNLEQGRGASGPLQKLIQLVIAKHRREEISENQN